MRTTGRTVLITGGTSGIGHGLAVKLHRAGSTVIVGGRRTDLLDEIVAANPGMDSVVLDVADPASIAAAFASVTRSHPDLDVVVTMAGIMEPENLLDASFLETSERVITTNLLGTIRTVAAFLPFLQQQTDAVLMTVSSGLAFVPLSMTPTYCATKAAVHSFTESLRVQLADTNVGVLELIPPAVGTDLMGQAQSGRGMPLGEYLDEVMSILATDATQICVENVKRLRFAEADGTYPEMLAMLSHR